MKLFQYLNNHILFMQSEGESNYIGLFEYHARTSYEPDNGSNPAWRIFEVAGPEPECFGLAIGVPLRRINEIVLGKRTVMADAELRLERYFGLWEGFPRLVRRSSSHGSPPPDQRWSGMQCATRDLISSKGAETSVFDKTKPITTFLNQWCPGTGQGGWIKSMG